MGLFRNVMGLFRGKAGKGREEGAAEPLKEPVVSAELPKEPAVTVQAQPPAAPREVKRESRPDPNKPGWGKITG